VQDGSAREKKRHKKDKKDKKDKKEKAHKTAPHKDEICTCVCPQSIPLAVSSEWKRAWMLDLFFAVVECSLLAERRAAVPLSSFTAHAAAATTSAWLGGARTYGASRTDTEEGLPPTAPTPPSPPPSHQHSAHAMQADARSGREGLLPAKLPVHVRIAYVR
jgi:hypothetical protein